MATIDVLIPTYSRPAALAVTLATLVGQTFRDFRVVVSDQTEDCDMGAVGEVQAVARVLRFHGHEVEILKHLPRRGMAEQRAFLLDQATAPYVLFSDDDLIFEPDALERMHTAIIQQGCGFVGCAVPGLSYLHDVRPHQQAITLWEGNVQPERVRPNMPEWERYPLHSAANILHVARQMGITPETQRVYRVAWVGGCTLYDTAKLRAAGGFDFWAQLPDEHAGEDVLAQLRVMERFGGCGLIPTRVYHQELPTTVANREVDAPKALDY
jgi:glycosyltransferase involved in cell wall biosynthesis